MINTTDIRQRLSQNTAIDAKEIQALCDEVESNQWVDVNDRLPEEGVKRYLCYMTSGEIKKGYLYKGEWHNDEYAGTFQELGYKMTHWKPLPKPPTD